MERIEDSGKYGREKGKMEGKVMEERESKGSCCHCLLRYCWTTE